MADDIDSIFMTAWQNEGDSTDKGRWTHRIIGLISGHGAEESTADSPTMSHSDDWLQDASLSIWSEFGRKARQNVGCAMRRVMIHTILSLSVQPGSH